MSLAATMNYQFVNNDIVNAIGGGGISDMNISEWAKELKDDIDKDFVLNGVECGFSIVDNVNVNAVVEVDNHSSCFSGSNKQKVEELLMSEINNSRLVPVHNKPSICSTLAAVDKSDDYVRLIFDASRPENLSLNSYATVHDHVKYERVQDALELIDPGAYLFKIDINSAYRALGIDPSQYHMSGRKWHFTGDKHPTYMMDTRLMMGATKARQYVKVESRRPSEETYFSGFRYQY